LTPKHKELIKVLEIVRVEEKVPDTKGLPYRPPAYRGAIARAFVAKAVLGLKTTRALLDRVHGDAVLRRICGWETRSEIPSESTFSRAFAEFAETGLASRAHEALVRVHQGERIVGHISRDSSAIEGWEPPKKKEPAPPREKRRRGRKKKGEVTVPKPPTRLQRQLGMSLEDMLADLPTDCDTGCKLNSKGHPEYWIGYKLHLDVADGQIPISAFLTSASVHDSQVALPLAAMTSQRVSNLYDLMDSAYDMDEIRATSERLGHVPIIDRNFKRAASAKDEHETECRRRKLLHFSLPEEERFNERTTVERVFSRLKEEFGACFVRVRGSKKVFAHLMFGVLALTADQLMRFVT
jgi:hypothetical protein